MSNIDNKNSNKPGWYERWHKEDHHGLVHWAIFILIVCGLWVVLNGQIREWFMTATNQVPFLNSAKQIATLSIDPETKTVVTGDTFSVNVILDTTNKQVDGVDLYALRYNPKVLKVIDDNPTQKGVQIEPGTLMELNSGNIVDEVSGAIKFSQLSAGGSFYTGKGIVATIHFKAIASGPSPLTIDFTRGKTVDSNAPYRGKDQLGSVSGSLITVQNK